MTPPPPAAIEEIPSAAPASNGGVTDGPMRLEDIYSRRKKTDKSQWGTAAPSRSENFKAYSHSHKPKAKKWDSKVPPKKKLPSPPPQPRKRQKKESRGERKRLKRSWRLIHR